MMLTAQRDYFRRPYVGKPKFPIYYCGLYMDDFSEPETTSRFVSHNQIVRVPVDPNDRWKQTNDWVATAGFSIGCPASWKRYPEPIHMLAERTNEDQAYPPYRPKNKRAKSHKPDKSSQQHQKREGESRKTFETRAMKPVVIDKPEEEEYDENNSNEVQNYIDDAEDIDYDSWITYMYPIIRTQPDNNDPLWVDPEQY